MTEQAYKFHGDVTDSDKERLLSPNYTLRRVVAGTALAAAAIGAGLGIKAMAESEPTQYLDHDGTEFSEEVDSDQSRSDLVASLGDSYAGQTPEGFPYDHEGVVYVPLEAQDD